MQLRFGRAAVIVAALSIFGSAALPQDAVLTSRDGSLSLSGSLIGFDGSYYRIDTRFGLLTVDAEGVICAGPACPGLIAPKAIIRIVGDGRAGRALLPGLLAAFAAEHGLDLAPGQPALLRDGATQQVLAEVSFIALPANLAQAEIAGGRADLLLGAAEAPGLSSREIALEALVPIASPNNPVPFVTTTDLARALSGEVTNWAEIGGPDRPLVLHGLLPDTDLAMALSARLGREVAATVLHPDLDALLRAVARDPYALSVSGQVITGPARIVPLRDSCGFPLVPNPMAIKSEDYPLTVPLFFQIPRRHVGLILREFLEFLATPAAEAAIAASGFVDRSVATEPLTDGGLRLINAINAAGTETGIEDLKRLTALMDGRSRLSLTFRFEGGSSRLNAHSQNALADLARMLESGMFADHDLTLAGFSDGSGSADANLDLSRARAQTVLAALRQLVPDLAKADLPTIEALGEMLPIACDETGAGRGLNRRVELWAKPRVQPR